jgi:hypothetical protein
VLAAALVAIAFFAGPNSPGDGATGAQVIAWYGSHHTADFVFDIMGGLAVLFLVLFAVALVRQVRTGDRWLAHGHSPRLSSAAWASLPPSVSTRFWPRSITI